MTPNVNESRAARLMKLYEDAEYALLKKFGLQFNDIVYSDKRIPAWVARKAGQLDDFLKEIKPIMNELEKASKETRDALLEASYMLGVDTFNDELPQQGADGLFGAIGFDNMPPESSQEFVALIDDMDGRFSELHRRILRDTEDGYRSVIGDILPNALLGVDSVEQATIRAVNEFAAKGIVGFEDRAGRHWGMAEYSEMAIRTGMKLAQIAGFTQSALARGYDLVIISDHQDTCSLCAKWERKVLSLTGLQADDPECDGWLADARAEGLFHPNCGHSMAVFVPGETDKNAGHDTSAKGRERDEQGYRNRQLQRYYERIIRRWKRVQAAAVTPEDERKAQAHVRQFQRKVRQLTIDSNLPRKYIREGGSVKLSPEALKLKPIAI